MGWTMYVFLPKAAQNSISYFSNQSTQSSDAIEILFIMSANLAKAAKESGYFSPNTRREILSRDLKMSLSSFMTLVPDVMAWMYLVEPAIDKCLLFTTAYCRLAIICTTSHIPHLVAGFMDDLNVISLRERGSRTLPTRGLDSCAFIFWSSDHIQTRKLFGTFVLGEYSSYLFTGTQTFFCYIVSTSPSSIPAQLFAEAYLQGMHTTLQDLSRSS